MSLYLYCVTQTTDDVPAGISGIHNQPVRAIDSQALRVVVSDFEGHELTPNKENVFTHERVIERLMDRTTPLPFRFGVVVQEPDLAHFMQGNAPTLRLDLENVRGCVEMGVKVLLAAVPAEKTLSGTEFLKEKLRLQELQKNTASWVDAAVVGTIRQTTVSLLSGSRTPIVRIAHLVLRDRLNEYKLHIEGLVRQRTDCGFLRSGPWPPYSFISTPRLD